MKTFTLLALLSAGIAQGLFLRNLPERPEAKVGHLCQDIEESVSKAGQDAEMVFATLLTYDEQLDTSLQREITTLNRTLTSLLAMQSTYTADLSSSSTELSNLGATLQDSEKMASKYETGMTVTHHKYDSVRDNVRMLVALLKNAQVTQKGVLVTPETPDANGEPARVYTAIRRLLITNMALKESHADVFDAFLKPLPADLDGEDAEPHFATVPMTPGLLQDLIGLLSAVGMRLQTVESQSLLQLNSLHSRFAENAMVAQARAQAQQGVEAENEQKAAELTFSINFTRAVLKMDQNFVGILKEHLKSNADMVYEIRDLRQTQLKMLRDLTNIFGEFGASPSSVPAGLSFLEAGTVTVDEASSSHGTFLGTVQSEAEIAIRNNGDTHAILMHVQALLDEEEPVTAGSVLNTMMEFQGVLSSVEAQRATNEEAKRRCESQKVHAKEQLEGVNANLALMTAAQDHAQRGIKAAQKNVQGIDRKAQALEKTSHDFSHISTQAIKSLAAQSSDRKTILMAVRKASEVLSLVKDHRDLKAAGGVRQSTVQLMRTLSDDISEQEAKEEAYRREQGFFQSEFARYIQDYRQLLDQRRRRYESSLGVLELHLSELASDLLAQKQASATGHELSEQSTGLCESVLRFYDEHTKTRAELSKALRSILPGMSATLNDVAIASASNNAA